MEFPPKALYPRRFQASPSQFPAEEVAAEKILREKLVALACCHEQVKITYHQLHSQIKIGLVEAGEVFASLAIPLMKLVGLKTTEMATEGRFAAVFLNADIRIERDQNHQMDAMRPATEITQNGIRFRDMKNHILSSKEENYAAKVETAGKEILDKQQTQLIQLVQILRHVDKQVNSHQDNILQMIDHHKTLFHQFIRKATYYINALHSQNHDTFPVTVKLLRVVFNNISEVLSSVDCGVKDFMQGLAEQMCYPMAKYVNSLNAEIKRGPCAQLLRIVNEMERARVDTRQELEDARERIKIAEETKLEISLRLKEAEEQVRRMKGSLAFLPARKKHTVMPTTALKCLGVEERQENDEKLLWELLRKKRRKLQEPESPIGTQELIRQTNKKWKSSVYRQSTKILISPQTTRSKLWIPLGVSPSVKAETMR